MKNTPDKSVAALTAQLLREAVKILDPDAAIEQATRNKVSSPAAVLGYEAIWLRTVFEDLAKGEITPERLTCAIALFREYRREHRLTRGAAPVPPGRATSGRSSPRSPRKQGEAMP